jgi:hypothetical protein
VRVEKMPTIDGELSKNYDDEFIEDEVVLF